MSKLVPFDYEPDDEPRITTEEIGGVWWLSIEVFNMSVINDGPFSDKASALMAVDDLVKGLKKAAEQRKKNGVKMLKLW